MYMFFLYNAKCSKANKRSYYSFITKKFKKIIVTTYNIFFKFTVAFEDTKYFLRQVCFEKILSCSISKHTNGVTYH